MLGKKRDQKFTLKSCNFTVLRKTTGTREHLSSCKSGSVASEYSIEVLKELNRHVLIVEQDKADHSRLAFMAGTKQRQWESLKASDKTLFFYVRVVAEAPAPFCWAPGRRRGKGRAWVSRGEGKDYKTRGIFKGLRIAFNTPILIKVNVTLLSFFFLSTACNETVSPSSHNKLKAELRMVPQSCSLQPELPVVALLPRSHPPVWTCMESLSYIFLKLI